MCVICHPALYCVVEQLAQRNEFLSVTEEACGLPRSQRLRDGTGSIVQKSRRSFGLTTKWDETGTARTGTSPTFHTPSLRALRNSGTDEQLIFPDRSVH